MSLTGKGALSLKKKDVKESNVPALGFKKVEWKHAPTVDDEFIDLTALSTPAEAIANGFVQPSLSELTSVNLQQFKTNLQLQSSARGLMADSIDYVVIGSSRIRLIVPALEGELFSGHIDSNAKTGVTFADQVALSVTGTLALGATDFNVGQAFPVGKFSSVQHGAVLVYADGQLMFRNTGNNPIGAGVTGDYREVPAGAGLSVLIRFNNADLSKDRNISVVANGAIVEAPNGSQLQLIEALAGQIDLMVPSLAQLAGVPETDFQATPNDVDLKAFGDRVFQNEEDIDSAEARLDVLEDTPIREEIRLDTITGLSSNNTRVPQFTNTTVNSGGASMSILTNTAADGLDISILKTGYYDITFMCQFSVGNQGSSGIGIDLTAGEKDSAPGSVSTTKIFGNQRMAPVGGHANFMTSTVSLYLSAGQVVTPLTGDNTPSAFSNFTIVRSR